MLAHSTSTADLSHDIQLDIWHWCVDNFGMESSICLLVILIALIAVFFGRKEKTQTSVAVIFGNKNKVLFNAQEKTKSPQLDTTPLTQRRWRQLTTLADDYERAAGFRAAGAIYHTDGDWPRFFIMHASARVYTATEEHYNAEGAMQYILLEQTSCGSLPYRVQVCDDAIWQQEKLSELYRLAQESASEGKACSVEL